MRLYPSEEPEFEPEPEEEAPRLIIESTATGNGSSFYNTYINTLWEMENDRTALIAFASGLAS